MQFLLLFFFINFSSGKVNTTPPAKNLIILTDTIRHYHNGKKIKRTAVSIDRNQVFISYVDGSKDSLDIKEAEKINLIPPSHPININEDDIIFTKVEIEPTFPGGDSSWTKFITGQIITHIAELSKDGVSGTCHIKFIVGSNGKVRDVEAMDKRGSKLAEVCVNAVMNGPNWVPGKQNGRLVNAYRIQPITFTLQ